MSLKNLSWNDIANAYDKHNHGRRARTLPMSYVAAWAERRTDLFHVLDNGSFVWIADIEDNQKVAGRFATQE